MSGRDFDLVDRASGEVVMAVRHLWPGQPETCGMCGREGYYTHAVPYHCGATIEPLNEGCWHTVCGRCYARWERWAPGATEYVSWFAQPASGSAS